MIKSVNRFLVDSFITDLKAKTFAAKPVDKDIKDLQKAIKDNEATLKKAQKANDKGWIMSTEKVLKDLNRLLSKKTSTNEEIMENLPSLDSLKYDPSKYAKNAPLGLAATLVKKAKERYTSGNKDRINGTLMTDIESSLGQHIQKKDKTMTKKLIDKFGIDTLAKQIYGGMDTMRTITDWIDA